MRTNSILERHLGQRGCSIAAGAEPDTKCDFGMVLLERAKAQRSPTRLLSAGHAMTRE
jgi:hypothetical protein